MTTGPTLSERVAVEIRVELTRRHWRYTDLAERTGISVATLTSKLRRNSPKPLTFPDVEAICAALDLDVSALVTRSGNAA